MRKSLRPDEEWARLIIQSHLGREVIGHDDGSTASLYDLRIGPAERPDAAIEVSRVQDTVDTLVWKKGPEKGVRHWATEGNWVIFISGQTKVKNLQHRLEPILSRLNERCIQHLPVDENLSQNDPALYSSVHSLGISEILAIPGAASGRVILTMNGQSSPKGAMVNTTGQGIAEWLADYLRGENRRDNLAKLGRSAAREHHIFLILTLAGTPFVVSSYFLSFADTPADEAPDKRPPSQVAHFVLLLSPPFTATTIEQE
jgi:hypothetical protein